MGNPFCWMELTTHDLNGATEFYRKVFDWEIGDMPGAPVPYKMVNTGKEPGAGMMNTPQPGIPNCWTVYIEVEDVDAMCAKIGEEGGKVWTEPMEVPDIGRFAIVCDPQGAYFGLWQSLSK